jgi:hypothetical protein
LPSPKPRAKSHTDCVRASTPIGYSYTHGGTKKKEEEKSYKEKQKTRTNTSTEYKIRKLLVRSHLVKSKSMVLCFNTGMID